MDKEACTKCGGRGYRVVGQREIFPPRPITETCSPCRGEGFLPIRICDITIKGALFSSEFSLEELHDLVRKLYHLDSKGTVMIVDRNNDTLIKDFK